MSLELDQETEVDGGSFSQEESIGRGGGSGRHDDDYNYDDEEGYADTAAAAGWYAPQGREDKGVSGVAAVLDPAKILAMRRDRRRFCLWGWIASAVIATVSVSVGVVALRRREGSGRGAGSLPGVTSAPPEESPSMPTPPPTSAPTTGELHAVLNALRRIYGDGEESSQDKAALDDPSSPQYRAAAWLANEDLYAQDNGIGPGHPKFLQRYALAVLFHSLNGEYYMFGESDRIHGSINPGTAWLTGSDECTWSNLGCSEAGNVDAASFSGWAYPFKQNDPRIGTLPTELTLLTNLRSFEIDGFNVGGTLEGRFSSQTLQVLTFNKTGLSGSLPDDLFLNNPNLQSLAIHYGWMNGTIPSTLWSLTSLENLTLNHNAFSGPLDINLHLLKNSSTNNSSSSSGSFSARFRRLSLRGNSLSGRLPVASLGPHLSNLEMLDLSMNRIEGSVGSQLASLTTLKSLELQQNDLTSVSESLYTAQLPSLQVLRLDYNPLVGTLSTNVTNLSSLRELRIGSSLLGGSLPLSALLSGALPLLEILDASGAKFSGSLLLIPEVVDASATTINGTASSSPLRELFLQRNDFYGPVPPSLALFRNLKKLLLYGNPRLTGSVPKELCELREAFSSSQGGTEGGAMVDLRASCDVPCDCCNPCVPPGDENGTFPFNRRTQ